MNVKYISNKPYKLTLNKFYEVVEDNGTFYKLINDGGLLLAYNKALFEEEVIVVDPPKVKLASDIEISITCNSTDGIISVGGWIVNLEISRVAGNCGILGINGVNEIATRVQRVYYRFQEDKVTVEDNFVKKLIKIIMVSLVDQIREQKICSMIAFSTNDDYEGYELWKILDELSTFQTNQVKNINSGAQIKTWIIDFEYDDEEFDENDAEYDEDDAEYNEDDSF